MRILLVEDDPMIGDSLAQSLRDESYAVDWVRDGGAVAAAMAGQHYDAVLLDLGLPNRDGLSVLSDIRDSGNIVAVIVLTARDGINDRIKGLDGGADDYVVKPFAVDEVSARLRAVMRRKGGAAGPMLSNGLISLDPSTHEASVDGRAIRLSSREFALLQALLLRPGAILSRSQLEDRIYGWNEEVESNAVEFLIHSLRKKLGSDSIKNIRGVGWMVAKAVSGFGCRGACRYCCRCLFWFSP